MKSLRSVFFALSLLGTILFPIHAQDLGAQAKNIYTHKSKDKDFLAASRVGCIDTTGDFLSFFIFDKKDLQELSKNEGSFYLRLSPLSEELSNGLFFKVLSNNRTEKKSLSLYTGWLDHFFQKIQLNPHRYEEGAEPSIHALKNPSTQNSLIVTQACKFFDNWIVMERYGIFGQGDMELLPLTDKDTRKKLETLGQNFKGSTYTMKHLTRDLLKNLSFTTYAQVLNKDGFDYLDVDALIRAQLDTTSEQVMVVLMSIDQPETALNWIGEKGTERAPHLMNLKKEELIHDSARAELIGQHNSVLDIDLSADSKENDAQNKELASEDKKLSDENKELASEDKKLSDENKELASKEKENNVKSLKNEPPASLEIQSKKTSEEKSSMDNSQAIRARLELLKELLQDGLIDEASFKNKQDEVLKGI